MKVSVLFSPNAGGAKEYVEFGLAIYSKFAEDTINLIEGEYGGDYIRNANAFEKSESEDYIEKINHSVERLISAQPDLFICVGGDGLAAYVANYFINNNVTIPVVGLAGGTANVGPIIQFNLEEFSRFDKNNYAVEKISAIEAFNGDIHASYAFNDVVIGESFLGTLEDEVVNLSAEELLIHHRKSKAKLKEEIITGKFRVGLNGQNILDYTSLPPDLRAYPAFKVAQIIISCIDKEPHYGRAIYGPLGSGVYESKQGVVAISDAVIVRPGGNEEGIVRFAHMRYLLFGERDVVEVSGLEVGVHIICDGNPYLLTKGNIRLKYHKNCFTIVKKEIYCEEKI